MRSAARLQAAIDILELIEDGIEKLGSPADVLASKYFRQRRFIGSKDRRAVSAFVYGTLRERGYHLWRLEHVGLASTARNLFASYLAKHEPDSLALFGADEPHAPTAFDAGERELLIALASNADEGVVPYSATLELPDIMVPAFQERFGDQLTDAMMALNQTAPFDLRLNPVHADNEVINNLHKNLEGIEKSEYSPIGYRSKLRPNITATDLIQSGKVEVQDEAAQLACYLTEVKPDMQVVDLCAGAGGKSLLLAALMNNTGTIHAFDIIGKRLGELSKRAARASVTSIAPKTIPASGKARMDGLVKLKAKADRVIIDAPCTGTGTWRRNPDQRWRLREDSVDAFSEVQLSLLNEGSEMVKPGGRLVYMTCSVLKAENEAVVEKFIEIAGESWSLINYQDIWGRVLSEAPMPDTLSTDPRMLQLAPHRHNTDGFFIAIIERSA
jgi:16S rRNA (cytosine967-C5)-methyltransferase